ncbi:hypothetical protein GSI_12480 [Ganoderma sinense ZZ0214-1]|uniref:MFS general substrate transporter n=1 Tax=Ganoderma sinense ZZ0214-1 TaxID=1077348 RepID=A0A2G8RSV4_9APHY|nr:hypothetical protein GSI_12480 [Ganoderma sinense ZZ0214-1]
MLPLSSGPPNLPFMSRKDVVSCSTVFVWAGFQTGNTVQLSIALARLLQPNRGPTSFRLSDQHALTSLTCFFAGSFLGRIGNHLGDTTRAWLVLGTFVQTLFTMAAALTAWQSGRASVSPSIAPTEAAWTGATTFVALGFMSASMGLQAIMGKRMNTEYASTVVLTTVYSELVAQKDLFTIHRRVISRDHRALSIALLFLGDFSGRAIVQTAGAPTALGVGAGIRLIITIWWLFVPRKEREKPPLAGQERTFSEADTESPG